MSAPEAQVTRIVSGGQTGADRGGLDAAIELTIDHGGYCPRGRRAEDGAIPSKYRLRETESSSYAVRTEANVRESDGTLVMCRGRPSGGTRLTCELARRYDKPLLVVNLDSLVSFGAPATGHAAPGEHTPSDIARWLAANRVEVLNVAGPRASNCPGIAEAVRKLLLAVLRR